MTISTSSSMPYLRANNKTVWRYLALLVVRNCVILARFLAIMRVIASRWSQLVDSHHVGTRRFGSGPRGSFRRGSSSSTCVIAGPSIGNDDNNDDMRTCVGSEPEYRDEGRIGVRRRRRRSIRTKLSPRCGTVQET